MEPSLIQLPRTVQPPRDIFSREGDQDRGKCFLMIASRHSSFLEPMEPKERVRIYRDEIPMGRKVLFDMEHLRTWAGNDEAQNPELRIDDAEFHRPPVGSWVVFYGKLLDFPSPTTKFPRVERSHYRRTERAASSDARVLSRALGMKVAVCKVLDRIDWH